MGRLNDRLAKLEVDAMPPPGSIRGSGAMKWVMKYEGETEEEAIALAGGDDGRRVLLWSCGRKRSDWEALP